MHRHDQELALTERHDTGLRPQDRTQHLLFPRPDGARVQAMIAARAESRTRALHLVLQGDVSDTGFTGLICEMARAAGLSGWVHTTYRGAVKLHLQGDSQAVPALSGEVQTGLGLANVANATADEAWRGTRLPLPQSWAILPSSGRPLGECRLRILHSCRKNRG